MKKSLTLCLLLSILQVIFFTSLVYSSELPELKLGEEYEFFISSDDANQWLEVKLPQNGSLVADTFTNPEVNIELKLLYKNIEIAADTHGTSHRRRVESSNLYADSYILNVIHDNGTGTYSIIIKHEPAAYSYEKRPGEYFRNAVTLSLNEKTDGLMGYRKEGDIQSEHWYEIEVDKFGALDIDITSERTLSFRAYLIEDDGSTAVAEDRHGSNFFRNVAHKNIVPGKYYLKLERTGGYGGYTIDARFDPQKLAHEDMAGQNQEEAREIKLGETVSGILNYYKTNRTESWYKVTTETPGELRFDIEAEGDLDIRAYLYDVDGRRQVTSDRTRSRPFRRVRHTHLLPGTYYLKVEQQSNAGGYNLVAKHFPNKLSPEELPATERSEAEKAEINELITGILGFYKDNQTRDHAWYKFETTQPGTFYFIIQRIGDLNVGATVYDEDGRLAQDIAGNRDIRSLRVENLYPGTYYLHLQKRSSYGGFELRPVFVTENLEPSQRPVEDFEMAPVLEFDRVKTGIIGFKRGNTTIDKSRYILRPESEKQIFVSVTGNDNLLIDLKLIDLEDNKDLVTDTSGSNSHRFVRLEKTDADEIAISIESSRNASSYFVYATQKQDKVMTTTTDCDFYLTPVEESKLMRIAALNTTDSSLSINSLEITGQDSDSFELKNSPSSIPSNDQTVIEVEFSPEKAGEFKAQLNIQTEEGSFNVSLGGTAFEKFPTEEMLHISSEPAEAWLAPEEPMRTPFVKE